MCAFNSGRQLQVSVILIFWLLLMEICVCLWHCNHHLASSWMAGEPTDLGALAVLLEPNVFGFPSSYAQHQTSNYASYMTPMEIAELTNRIAIWLKVVVVDIPDKRAIIFGIWRLNTRSLRTRLKFQGLLCRIDNGGNNPLQSLRSPGIPWHYSQEAYPSYFPGWTRWSRLGLRRSIGGYQTPYKLLARKIWLAKAGRTDQPITATYDEDKSRLLRRIGHSFRASAEFSQKCDTLAIRPWMYVHFFSHHLNINP